jgi:MraZ protein
MFRGENKITLDPKGRLAVPTRYRESIASDAAGKLVVTIDHRDRCLLIYMQHDWEDIQRKLTKLPALNPMARDLQRLMIGHATDIELDSHGRVLIPPNLREYAGLNRDVVLSGQGTRFELWDEALWVAQREAALQAYRGNQELPPELNSISL